MAVSRFPAVRSAAYFKSYFKAGVRSRTIVIETIEVARRSIHNEAAELLQTALDGKISSGFRYRAPPFHC